MIFKRVIDPRIGSVTTLRVFSGTLRMGQEVLNSRTGERIEVGRLVRMLANEPEDVELAAAGDIASVVDMPVQGTGDTLCSPEHPLSLEPMTFPQPVAVIALEAATPEDSQALEAAVIELVDEDPTLRLAVDAHSGQLLVRGVGELQLEVLAERIRQDFRIHCRASRPQVSYMETLGGQVTSSAQFSKEIQGRQERASLTVSISPSERGVGIRVVWGADLLKLKKDFLRATEEGLRAGLRGAGTDGLDVVDVEIEVLELSDLDGTKNELAFQWVGRECVRKALAECKTIRLEPQMKVEIVTPDDYMGPVVGDLNARRGKVSQVLARAKQQVIVATVPLSTMFGYASDLRSLTQGRASFTMQFERYECVVPPSETSV
jgi:elongation factor G